MSALIIIHVRGIRVEYELNLGDLVLTYNGELAQVREIESEDSGRKTMASIKLNTGDWVSAYELTPVRWLGYRAGSVMKERGKSGL